MPDLSLIAEEYISTNESLLSECFRNTYQIVIDLTIEDQRDIEVTLDTEMIA